MKFKPPFTFFALLCAVMLLPNGFCGIAAEATAADEVRQPHTPTLIFYLTGATNAPDAEAIRAAVQKLKSATTMEVNTNRSYTRIRFDSHVVSYHQVAQAVAEAGKSLGKNYDPYLVFIVSEYARSNNAAGVDAIFAGKRLNTRVHVSPVNKSKGEFNVHFLPLKVDPTVTAPQGFNGGHLHHPISDPPPRGLGLTSDYAADYDEHVCTKQPDACGYCLEPARSRVRPVFKTLARLAWPENLVRIQ